MAHADQAPASSDRVELAGALVDQLGARLTGIAAASDMEFRQSVIDALDPDQGIDGHGIGAAAEHDVATLTGHVKSLAGEAAVERAASREKDVVYDRLKVEA